MAELTKEEKIAKAKKLKRAFLILVIVIAALLLTWGVLVLIKKQKQKKILQAEESKKIVSSNSSSSNTSSAGDDRLPLKVGSSGANVKAIQVAINKKYPLIGLTEDGNFGEKTKEAIVRFYGSESYPVNDTALTKIITGTPVKTTTATPKADTGRGDDFPLTTGSSGLRVQGLKSMINKITGTQTVDYNDPNFDQATYLALITKVGSQYYPVTPTKYEQIADKANAPKKIGY